MNKGIIYLIEPADLIGMKNIKLDVQKIY